MVPLSRILSQDEIPDACEKDVANQASPLVLKELFLKQFTPVDYRRFYESKLKNRFQGKCKPVSEYYYDILDLCRVVNQTMPRAEKLDHLLEDYDQSLSRNSGAHELQRAMSFARSLALSKDGNFAV